MLLSLGLVSLASAGVAERDWQRFTPMVQVTEADAVIRPKMSLVTDLPPDRAQSLLYELHRFDALVDEYIAPFVPIANDIAPALTNQRLRRVQGGDTLQLLVLRRRKDFLRLFRSGHFSAFTLPALDKTTLVVGPGGEKQSLRENLLHEYVHYRLRRDVPGGLPLWFEEGLASFLSEATLTQTGDNLGHGYFVHNLTRWRSTMRVRQRRSAEGLAALLARRDLEGLSSDHVLEFYRTSHAFVRYLYITADIDPEVLARALVLGEPSFPDGVGVSLRQAANALKVLRSGRQVRPFKGERAQVNDGQREWLAKASLTVAQVQPNQIRAELAEAALLMNPQRSRTLYAEISTSEPENLNALLGAAQALRLQAQMDAARVALARAQKLAPGQPEVLVAQAAMSTTGCIVQRREKCIAGWRSSMLALRDALDVQPQNYEAIYRLGITHLYLGQPGEAQGYLEIAWQRVPWSPRVNYFLGESMRLAGDTRSRWYLSNAQRWAGNDYFRAAAGAALASLATDSNVPEGATERVTDGVPDRGAGESTQLD